MSLAMYSVSRYISKTHHPVSALFSLVALNIVLDLLCGGIILGLKAVGQLSKLINGARLHKLFVVKMVKQNVQAFFCIFYLRQIR